MKKELEEKLGVEFPFMKRRKSLQEQKTEGCIYDLYGAFGCDVSDGWYNLIHDMCAEIEKAYKEANLEVDIVPVQVKEKFGSLRFYYDIREKEKNIHAIDALNVGSIRIGASDNEGIYDKVREIIYKYEDKSKSVCERCGKEGELRRDLGWITCLCDACHQEELDKRSKKQIV